MELAQQRLGEVPGELAGQQAEAQRPGRRGCGGEVGLKLETLHGSFLLLEDKLALTLVNLWSQAGVLLLHAEVVFNQVESLLVDLLVLVALQELDLVQACRGARTHTQFILFNYFQFQFSILYLHECQVNDITKASRIIQFKISSWLCSALNLIVSCLFLCYTSILLHHTSLKYCTSLISHFLHCSRAAMISCRNQ